MKRRNNSTEPPLCQCGCGQPTIMARNGSYNSYLLGHNSKSRDNAGKWRPGQSGNPAGCKTGSRNKVTVAAEHILEEQAAAISEQAVQMGLAGDRSMIKLILDKCVAPKRSTPVKLSDMPAVKSVADGPKLTAYILDAVASGKLSPVDAETISRSCERHLKALQVGDLEVRLEQLEQQLIGQGDSA